MGRNVRSFAELIPKWKGGSDMSISQEAITARRLTGSKLDNNEVLLGLLRLSPEIRSIVCGELDQIMENFIEPFPVVFNMIRHGFNALAEKYQLDPAILYWVYLRWTEENKATTSQ